MAVCEGLMFVNDVDAKERMKNSGGIGTFTIIHINPGNLLLKAPFVLILKTYDMKQQSLVDYSENMVIRDAAIQQGVDHADRKAPGWAEQAYEMLKLFVEVAGEFIAEDFRAFCKDRMESPPDERAYGGIIQKGVRRKLIVHTGKYQEMKAKHCHMNPKKVWKKL